MARPREFDRSRALQRAMELFWKQGYEATSVADLGAHLGLNPGSLYNTFKDKHSLFLEALDCYQERGGAVACQFFQEPPCGLQAIRRFFEMVIDTDLRDPDRKGCMMVNSAAELASRDPEVQIRVEASRMQMIALFHNALAYAQQNGEIGAQRDPQVLATFLVNNLFGLRITAKTRPERDALYAIMETTIQALG